MMILKMPITGIKLNRLCYNMNSCSEDLIFTFKSKITTTQCLYKVKYISVII